MLPSCFESQYPGSPTYKKTPEKKMVNKAVNEYWIEHIKKMSTYFKSLDYLNASNYSNGKAHAALTSIQTSARDVARLPVKL
jgi:hypothetical protein